ncbi:ankyrin [Fusarium beomiforme]|uniref:Ankyrin n=1 Tax=Fusarium beomiforme TaxID=44412 RepID=A0A9P5A697_9HYPO|nr:ankyrin [Fusarium beomiforme]
MPVDPSVTYGNLILEHLKRHSGITKPVVEKALQILDLGVDAGATDNDGNNALHFLATYRDLSKPDGKRMLERLIQSGADPNARNVHRQTPLHRLRLRKYSGPGLDDLKTFLAATKADVNIPDNQGNTLIFSILDASQSGAKIRLGKEEEFVNFMADAGARFDVTDQRGRSLLHAAVRYPASSEKLLQLLVKYGVDPKQADYEGNTIWHEGVSHWRLYRPVLQDIFELGCDPWQANHHGRTPLHVLCEHDQWAPERSKFEDPEKQARTTLFDYLLQQTSRNINIADNDGVTPLHLVSTFSTEHTRQLLEIGADPTLATHEGMNVFHLAARCRQSNTIGLLIDHFRERSTEDDLQKLINSKDKRRKTPLYYACCSGVYQSVELLIEAGAVDTETYHGSALSGCADFENKQPYAEPSGRDSGSVLVDDARLPKKHGSQVARLEEILGLVMENARVFNLRSLDTSIAKAVECRHDYTVQCLLWLRERLRIKEQLDCAVEARLCVERRNKDLPSMKELKKANNFSNFVPLFLDWRFYDAFPTFIKEASPKPQELHSALENLALLGFAGLLDTIISPEVFSSLEWKGTMNGDGAARTVSQSMVSLLLSACESEEPNMRVIQVLLSKGARLEDLGPPTNYDLSSKPQETLVHAVVRGGSHPWWHTRQLLPRILGQDVSFEVRDSRGLTPLNASLENMEKSYWSCKATEMLLQAGADPNSVDDASKSCLSRAVAAGNKSVYDLLVQYGANIDHSALFAAIVAEDVDMVRLMLSSGADPNARKFGKKIPACTSEDGSSMKMERKDPSSAEELYPLDFVITEMGCSTSVVRSSLIEVLLEYGADPNARYPQTTVAHRLLQRKSSNPNMTYSTRNPYLDLILEHPLLDVNLQDKTGLSLLRAAYEIGDLEAAQNLLDRGANI